MNVEDIEKFFKTKGGVEGECVKINFKQREPIYGLFVKDNDYSYLKEKNFWRIIPQSQFEAFKTSKNLGLARIFNGAEFSKLTAYQDSFE